MVCPKAMTSPIVSITFLSPAVMAIICVVGQIPEVIEAWDSHSKCNNVCTIQEIPDRLPNSSK
jgi:hypothetical protein